MVSYLCLSTHNILVFVSSESPFFRESFKTPFTISALFTCVLRALLWTPLQNTTKLKDKNALFNVFSSINFSHVCPQAFDAIRVISWLFCHIAFPHRVFSLASVLRPHVGLIYRSQTCLKERRCPLREHVRECVCRFSFNYLGNCQL